MESLMKQLTKRRMTLYGGLILANVIIFGYTRPLNSASWVIILGFLTLGVDIWLSTSLLLRFFSLLLPRLSQRRTRLTVAITSFELMVLALLSVGQQNWRDIMVVTIVWAVGYIYLTYVRSSFVHPR
jgi:hypothetical protein